MQSQAGVQLSSTAVSIAGQRIVPLGFQHLAFGFWEYLYTRMAVQQKALNRVDIASELFRKKDERATRDKMS
jgi:hypothetical protein